MDDFIKYNNEVEINQKDLFTIDKSWINRIKILAKKNHSGKYRTCIHKSEQDSLHEMLIVHTSGAYVRPHKHRTNSESLQIIEGDATAIIFNNDGSINQAFKVGAPDSNNTFYYKMDNNIFHMLLIASNFLVFKETTKGPFNRNNTIFPKWAPNDSNRIEVEHYIKHVESLLVNII